MALCTAITKKGLPCRKLAMVNSTFCKLHTSSETSNDNNIVMMESDEINTMSDDISTIDYKIAASRAIIALEQAKIKDLMKIRKLYEQGDKKVITKAKSMFYHENKTNPDMILEIVDRLKNAGLYTTKKIKGRDIPDVPYQLIRKYTDNVFDKLEGDKKELYMIPARAFLVTKNKKT